MVDYDDFLKACAETWFNGGNPDMVDQDAVEELYDEGFDCFDIGSTIARKQLYPQED